ncbi:MAG: hypothetical protein ACP5HG_02120 [Anaerolineae bacterium]
MTAGSRTEQRSLIILSFVLVVVMLGYGVIIPIFPFYSTSRRWGAAAARWGSWWRWLP